MTDPPGAGRISGQDMPLAQSLSAKASVPPGVVTDAELRALLDRLSLDDKARLTAGRDIATTEDAPAIALGPIKMVDGPMGVTSGRVDERDVSLLTPCGTALAASWDRDLVQQIGALIGDEARRRNVQAILGPNLNLPRSPLAGRAFETFAEDPLLAGMLGASWITGLQSRGVAAVAKHLVGNDSETERRTMNSVIDERALREVYLLPFEIATQTGVWGIMTAYNRVNGIYCVEHRMLISQVLKTEWQWDGLVMSDWFGTNDTVRDALAGLDLEMPGPARYFGEALARSIRACEVGQDRLDDAVERLLRLAARVGQLGPEATDDRVASIADPHALLRTAAAAGFVLLKNENNLLPLAHGQGKTTVPTGKRIAVIGPNAAVPCYQGATFARIALEPGVQTPLAAIRTQFGVTHEVIYEPGVLPEYRLPPLTVMNIRAAHDGTSRGLTVDFYAGETCQGEPIAREVRNSSTLVWFGQMPGIGALNRNGCVHASTILTPDVSGTHTFYVGGTGAVRLLINGQEVASKDQKTPAADIMGTLTRGDSTTVEHTLAAGVPIRLDIEMQFAPARAQGIWFGCQPPVPSGLLDRAETAAADADVVVLVVGETPDSGVESADRSTTKLPANQVELIERVRRANPATIIVVNAAHAVDMPWADRAAAVLCSWFSGQEFGPALAAILSGDLEPGGRLPITIAKDEADYPAFDLTPDPDGDAVYAESTLIGYRSFEVRGIAPQFCFGHGLGYADFSYEGMHIRDTGDGSMRVEVMVRNTSNRRGKEVVQLYVTGPLSELSPVSAAELKGFATLALDGGEVGRASILLDGRSFAHWSEKHHTWQVKPGVYGIRVGRSSQDIRLNTEVVIDQEQ